MRYRLTVPGARSRAAQDARARAGALKSAMPCDSSIDRRMFITFGGVAAAAALLEVRPAYGDALTKAQRDSLQPDKIIELMKQGNRRFRHGHASPHNYLAQQKASAKAQHPAAILLSCVDSRAPAETIMDLGIGDCFNARVAGNVVNEDILGSMEFACKLAGAKVIVVMGHTSCGAIKGAIEELRLGNLSTLLAKIRPAVSATEYEGERSAGNYGFVDAVARKNVELTMAAILRRSSILDELARSNAIRVIGAMYDLDSGVVEFFS